MPIRSYRTWLLGLALLGVTVDQASKYLVFNWLHEHPTHYDSSKLQGNYPLIPGAFKLHVQYTPAPAEGILRSWSSPQLPHVNHGALFGLMNNHKISANYFFAVVSIIAAVAIIVWTFRRHSAGDRLLCTALGLILGGTIGNLYDRLVFDGVRDFLYWDKWFSWPVFNIADCCLVCGALLLLAQAFLTNPPPSTHPTATETVPLSEPVAATPEMA